MVKTKIINERYVICDNGVLISLSTSKRSKSKIIKPIIGKDGYIYYSLSNNGLVKTCLAHRLVAKYFFENFDDSLVVNHKDGNKTNNNISNLELITQRENLCHSINKNKTTSSYIGVSWSKRGKKWRATITINKKNIYLGSFNNEVDAYNARKVAENKYGIINKYS